MKPESFESLIHRHLDGAATPEEASRLALALLEDPAAARAYAEATRLESGLRTCLQAEVVGRRLGEGGALKVSTGRRPARRWVAAAAAAAGLAVAGMSLAWWRSAGRSGTGPAMVAEKRPAAPRTVAGLPGPPPSLRRPGALSPAAAEVKRLVSRYWLPDRIEFTAMPLEEAVVEVQRRAGAVNHRQNGTITSFAIDLPDEVASAPVTASRANLPLGAWLELLSAQTGCELRYTETGVAFDQVEQPDALETRRFPLPTVAERGTPDAPDGSPGRLFSYARPWDEEPNFRSAPAHGATLAAAWGIDLPAAARAQVRDGQVLEVRHTRRELRRIEGLLAVAAADAGRPLVTLRAKEVPLPAPAPAVAFTNGTWSEAAASVDDFIIDLNLVPEVVEFEGFINYGRPIETVATDANGQPQTVVLTESRIEQPVFATRLASGNRVVSNEEAAGLLGTPHGQLSSSASVVRSLVFEKGYQLGLAAAATGGSMEVPDLATIEATVADLMRERVDATSFHSAGSSELPSLATTTMDTEQTVVLGDRLEVDQPAPDPWQSAAISTVGLGESAWLATGGAAPVVAGKEITPIVGFSLMDLQPPPPLNTIPRLEGEMVKLTGSYTPPGGGSAPTDFEAYVVEGQSLVLQTEDAPVVPAPGHVVSWYVDLGDVINGRAASPRYYNWAFRPQSAGVQVRGLVVSPVLEWPAVVSK